tara:strand:+ start:1360 stop:2058 length:699 start_codon:yes stop_codon:yes gene_type:complete
MAYERIQLQTGQHQEQLRNVVIKEIKTAQSGDWQMKINIPDFSGKFDHNETVFGKKTEGFDPKVGNAYKVMVKRDSLKTDKDGNVRSGDYDDHYWHSADWTTRQIAEAVAEVNPDPIFDPIPEGTPVATATTNSGKTYVQPIDDFRVLDRNARARNSREAIAKDIIVASINKVDSVTPTKAIVLMALVSKGADLIEGKQTLNDVLKSIEHDTDEIHALMSEILGSAEMKSVK